MPFEWQEFLGLAERLLEVDSEAAYRTAISRAYYSVFNVARERAERNNCRFDPDTHGGMHKKCWDLYRKGPDPGCTQLGIDGGRLSEVRTRADYKSGEYVRLKEEATQFIDKIKAFRQKLTALDARYPKP